MDGFDPALQESDWLRRLARSLVRDAHGAEDALQETWAAALEQGPGPRRSLRAWLGTILRNEVRQAARARARRERHEREGHERAAGARGDEPGSDDVAARLELQALVLEAVRGLEEPYRGAIVARFFDGLAPREIARRDGLPVKTVNTRLDRALGKLRARLDARCGGERERWLQALAPFISGGGGIGTWLGEGAAMGAKAKVAAGVVVVLGIAWVGKAVLEPEERARALERAAAPTAELEPRPAEEALALAAPGTEPSETRSILDVERAPAAADARSALAAVRRGGESATLDVRVRLQGTGAAPNQALVLVTDAAPDVLGEDGVSALFEGRTRPLAQGGADVSGAVRLDVPAGRPLWVSVDPHRWTRVGRSKPELVQRTTVPVEPLAPGEVRALGIELVHGSDRVFLGEVVAAEDGRALVDAKVEPDESFGEPVTSDAKGLFELPYASWDPPGEVRIAAPGYSPRFLRLQWVDQEPGVPFVVALAREATLVARVAAQGRAGLELVARARTDRGGEPELRVRLDEAGRGEIAVPAELPLDLELRAGEGELLWTPPEPPELAAGERRELVLDLGAGTLVHGVLRDGAGVPLGERELWAVRPEPGESVAGATSFAPGELEGAQVARSRADGRFEFAALASGPWWIGPAPRAVNRWGKPERDPEALAPLFVGVELAPGEGARRVDLVTYRDLWIEGRVVREDGRPAPNTHVYATRRDLGPGELRTVADPARGEFCLGPLVPGAYELRLFAEAGMGWNDEPVVVEAGTKDVVLVYRPGRAIAGRVVDEQGHAVDASVHLLRARQGSLGQSTSSVDQGAFLFHSLDAGECFVQAGMPDGRVAVERVELAEDGRVSDLVLTVRAGARIGVRHDLERGVRCAIWCDGRLAADSTISPGEENFETVPSGPIRVELYEGGATLAVRDLTARADRVESLEFDLR